MPNIKFSYLYRDGGNYKNYNSVYFANPDNIGLDEFRALIKSQLIDGTWFYHNKWQVPDLRPTVFDCGIDPGWHEFESIAHTTEEPNTAVTLTQFIKTIEEKKVF
jgi:hypothetical protein